MTHIEEADSWIGQTAVDDTGEQVGMISEIWVDDVTGRPAWASVMGPALGAREVLVPLAGAVALGGGHRFAYTKEQIAAAPQVAEGGRLDEEGKEQLCAHYGTADAGPGDREDSWFDRVEEMTGGAGAPSAPPAGPGAEKPGKGRRFQRRPGRKDQKAGRRLGRRSAAPDQPLAPHPVEPDELPLSG